jgi:opacity protein-like surface antigen
MDDFREQQFRRTTMKFRTRMIATMAAVALLVPPFLFAAEGSTNSTARATAIDSAVTRDSAGSAEASAASASAQYATPASPSTRSYRRYPKAELFLGYSYVHSMPFQPMLTPGNRMVRLNGGSASIAFNLNRYLGLVGDFGGFDVTKLQIAGAGANPPRAADASGTAYTFMAGPRLSFRYSRVTPFVQVLFGGVHASAVTLSNCTGVLCTPLPSENSFAMTAGGGIDLKIHRHIAIRIVQAEYLMTNFADLSTGNVELPGPVTLNRNMQNDIRLSSGLVFGFGGNTPLPAVEYTCSTSPSMVYPGDPITVTGVALNLNPKKTASYTWSSDGGAISGTSNTANIDTKTLSAGTYTVKGHVSEGVKPGQMADCSAQFTVKPFDPPTISCTANPSSVNPGDSSMVAASALSPQNRPLTYSYNATAGSISSTTPSATLSTAGAAPGPITVSCNVVDDKGQSASATTSVNVIAPPPPPPPPAPLASSLCTVSFERDATRPTRVDNEAKACLDDIALNLQRSTDAKLALVGNEDAKEQAAEAKEAKLKPRVQKPSDAVDRAVNTKQYLVNEKGIDPTRILLYTGTDDAKTVTTTLIPAGAVNPAIGDTPVN